MSQTKHRVGEQHKLVEKDNLILSYQDEKNHKKTIESWFIAHQIGCYQHKTCILSRYRPRKGLKPPLNPGLSETFLLVELISK